MGISRRRRERLRAARLPYRSTRRLRAVRRESAPRPAIPGALSTLPGRPTRRTRVLRRTANRPSLLRWPKIPARAPGVRCEIPTVLSRVARVPKSYAPAANRAAGRTPESLRRGVPSWLSLQGQRLSEVLRRVRRTLCAMHKPRFGFAPTRPVVALYFPHPLDNRGPEIA